MKPKSVVFNSKEIAGVYKGSSILKIIKMFNSIGKKTRNS